MQKNSLFSAMYKLTEQLKGAPLREDEEQELVKQFKNASGSPYEKAISAMVNVLHCKSSLIFEKSEALENVNKLFQDVKKKADEIKLLIQEAKE